MEEAKNRLRKDMPVAHGCQNYPGSHLARVLESHQGLLEGKSHSGDHTILGIHKAWPRRDPWGKNVRVSIIASAPVYKLKAIGAWF